MRDVAIVAFAQSPARSDVQDTEVEMLMPVVAEALERAGFARRDIGFTVSGTCDYVAGQPFAFVGALDALGAWPPISESHVEMDGAWALYEAWVRLQCGDVDSALVYAVGKSSAGRIAEVLGLQLDPYTVAPLGPDAVSLEALQARAHLEATGRSERDLARVAARSRRDAAANPNAQISGDVEPDELLRAPYVASPLRAHDCPPATDQAAAVVLASSTLARRSAARPAWIRGIDHRIDPQGLGLRDLARSRSAALASERSGATAATPDVAELHAAYSHHELILRDALGLDDRVAVNPSGGALCANALMVAGLIRIGEAAGRVMAGASLAVAHAASGPCLQQNLVCVLGAGP